MVSSRRREQGSRPPRLATEGRRSRSGGRQVGLGLLVAALGVAVLALARGPGSGASSARKASPEDVAADPGATASERGPLAFVDPGSARAERAPPEREALAPAAQAPAEPLAFRREDLYGTVLDARTRAPIAGASVQVLRVSGWGEPPPPEAVLTTDGEGRFRLADALEKRDALVLADGYAVQQARLVPGQASEVLLTPALTLAGRVLWRADRRPVEGALVRLDWPAVTDLRRLATEPVSTDAGGRFALPGVPPRADAWIAFALPGDLPDRRALRVEAEPPEELELLLGPRGALRLRMLDLENGTPLAGFRCRIEGAGSFTADDAGEVALGYDAERLVVADGGLRVEVWSESACTTRRLVAQDALSELHDVPITRGARVEGFVRDERGEPIAWAQVSLRIHDPVVSSPLSELPGLPAGVVILSPVRTTRTDGEGRFALERLFASAGDGKAELLVRADGLRDASLSVDVPAPGGTRAVEVVLARGAGLRARVLDRGEPCAGMRVRAVPSGEPFGSHGTTDDDGACELAGLEPGPTRVTAEGSDGAVLAEASVTLAVGEMRELELVLTRTRSAIEGRVLDEQGQPLPQVLVYRRDEGRLTIGPGGMQRGLGNVSTRSDDAGRFRLEVQDGAEPLEVVAWRDAIEASASALPGASDLVLVLPASGLLRLDVSGADGERLSALSQVLWWPAGSSRSLPASGCTTQVAPGPDGRFELRLAAGRWDLELRAAPRAPALVTDVAVASDAPCERSATLRRGTTLEVRFLPGGPTESKMLRVIAAEERRRQESGDTCGILGFLAGAAQSTPEGGLVARGLAPGTYLLDNVPTGWAVDPATIEVPDVERHEVTLRWVSSASGR